jgi:ribosomal protein S19
VIILPHGIRLDLPRSVPCPYRSCLDWPATLPEMAASGRLKTFLHSYLLQADSGFTDPTEAAELKRKRTFKKYTYRGIELDKLLDLKNEEFIDVSLTMAWAACSAPTSFKPFDADTHFSQLSARSQLVHARARRRFQRGLKRKPLGLIKKLRKAKKEAAPNEKPATVKTHLRDMIIVPEMIGSVCGVYVSLTMLEGRRFYVLC